MRKRFEVQLALGKVPIERVVLPLNSRDELPPILAGLQWIFQSPEINSQIFALLESKLVAGKKATGRPGLDLWHILVLGVVRLGLDCDYDRLEYLANYDSLLRQILGLSPVQSAEEKPFHYKTLSENMGHVDEELLQQINAIVAQAGRAVFKKKENGSAEPICAKADTYVLETNVHFPTDLNLLWDAQRKCLELAGRLARGQQLEGWRKAQDWRHKLKGQLRVLTKLSHGGGRNKEQRVRTAAEGYLRASERLEAKVFETMRALRACPLGGVEFAELIQLDYFHTALIKQMDLVERRLLREETIAHQEKVFSLFEPHTQWIAKGKLFPPVELGHPLLITTDQHELILDYQRLNSWPEVGTAIPLADRLLGRYGAGNIVSLSFDKGFSRQEDQELLELYIPQVVMPKRGKRNRSEEERESQKSFRALRNRHQAIESDINCLEHHGLNRCLDKGLHGFERYIGFGVLSYNRHKIGARLLQRKQESRLRQTALRAAA
jgi:IS5 family transposase